MTQPHLESESNTPPPTPRWVKGLGIIGLILVLLFGVMHLTGNTPTHGSNASPMQHGIQQP